jgi:integrase
MPKSLVFRNTATKCVPAAAVVTTLRGRSSATWTARGGVTFKKPVHLGRDGRWRYRWISPTYRAKLYLPAGGFVLEDTGCADKGNAIAYMVRRRQELESEHANPALAAARHAREVAAAELDALVDDFITRGIHGPLTSQYRATTRRYLVTCFEWCAWSSFADIDERGFGAWQTAIQRDQPSPSKLRQSVGAVKRFTRWTARQLRIEDPLQWVDGIAKAEPQVPRRCLSPDELVRLREAAMRGGKQYRRARGQDQSEVSVAEMNAERSLIYAVLYETGLRTSQLRRLHRDDLVLDGSGNASLKISNPQGAKRHKWGEVALSRQLAGELQAHLQESNGVQSPSSHLMFRWRPNMLARLREDLERAGIPVKSRQGAVCLHSFRHSANAMLEEVHATPTLQQRHLGHATPLMTQTVYAKRREIDEVRPYVERIAAEVAQAGERLKRTD